MYNITFSKDSESEFKKNEMVYEKKFEEVFSKLKKSNCPLYNFAKIFIKNIPFNLIEILSNDDLFNFMEELFNVLNSRKRKKFLQTVIKPEDSKFFIGNFSIITINTDDRPFLVDSIREYFYDINLNQQFILHPIFSVKRNSKGEVIEVDKPGIGTKNESFVTIFIEDIDKNELDKINQELSSIYDEVSLTVDDYPEMSNLINNLSLYYKNKSPEVAEFLTWINNKNFIVQGVRILNDIDLEKETYKVEQYGVYKLNRTIGLIPNMIKALKNNTFKFINGYPIVFDKALYSSKVKKRKNYDRIILVDKKGDSYSLISIIGILSKDALKTPPYNISIIKHKIDEVVDHFGFVNGSHDHKWLIDILDAFPKTEIISLNKDTLINILKTVFSMQGKNQIVFYTKNFKPLKNYYVFMTFPQEKFSVEILEEIKNIFQSQLDALTLDVSVRNDEHGYVFAHFHFYLKDIKVLEKVDYDKIKYQISELIKDWKDELYEALKIKFSGIKSDQLYQKFSNSFSETYKTKCTPEEAAEDIKYLSKLKDISAKLYIDETKTTIKLYSRNKILLTDIMPVINNIGIKVNEEFTYKVKTQTENLFINSIHLAEIENPEEFKENYSKILPELVLKVVKNNIENDKLNKLCIIQNLNYRQIDFLRAVRNYIEQINPLFRRVSLNDTLLNNNQIAKLFINYLYEKFEPSKKKRDFESISNEILSNIDKVLSVQEDSILRHFYKVIVSIIRTNYFIPDKDYISFKIKSKELDILPDPKPLYEIYVHSAHMEGIHLRGGKVARGGLRFSDRPDDFRTEILGLVKTQMVKNTVIVPVGSKGGFIVKKRFADREMDKEHVINQYKTLIKGLLDITDNYKGKKIVHPEHVVIYDEKDPYLVVAADKGTATFSDIANSVSREYGFWLDDAFASGGSAGYDHKKVGITAKGAWESVKRHFRELGKDTQTEPFTVVGIGDMSGDVFGNGMLLSKKIKLIAAFNHMHIFIDPDPDPESSYIERLRMFKLPRSTWRDYNPELISQGGGVFDRSAKKIELSPEIKEVLEISKDSVSGEELIKYILKANVELLWNGGIGTYVKDDNETNEQVGDKANDNVRINASELRVKVVGEGGNLGLTQKARIRFALNGGLINTDAIDNSAGVDMSDHEVNLKILFDILMKNGEIKDMKARNSLIAKLTPEVTNLVLKDNYLQTQILSCDLMKASDNIISYIDAAEFLRNAGLLNYKIEDINFIKEKRPITRPELSVLLAYTKIHLFDSSVNELNLDHELLKEEYIKYYPQTVIDNYGKYIDEHKLKREITATVAVNKAVNQAGIPFFLELHKTTGQSFAKLIETYIFADKLLNTCEVREKIESLDLKIDTKIQYFMLIELEKTLKVAVNWLINDNNFKLLQNNLETFKEVCGKITNNLRGSFKDDYKSFLDNLKSNGCKTSIAKAVCDTKFVKPAFDLFEIIVQNKIDISNTIANYFEIGTDFNLPVFLSGVKKTQIKTTWDRINKDNLLYRIKIFQKEFCEKYTKNGKNWLKAIEKEEQIFFMNYNNFLESINAGEFNSLIPYNVMLDSLFNMLNSK